MEQVAKDPSFALSAIPHPNLPDDVDHPQYSDYNADDDTALSARNIAQLQALNPGNTQFTIWEMAFCMADDGEVGYQAISDFDNEILTDCDADGDMDPNGSSDMDLDS
ncbi:hypothetical protein BS47DRAFT_1399626 [Hydnum rufescens UP504]|uniref:Uncharacterized protein n=1 Tax=Hydnum rufescens UP504 TaxID=1448309 RepID=A0A9P6AK29_9AGAM|nr:hypothetical protein BS47DRAFT_1399626 [Hydnum rufescens UP504]